MQLSIIWSDGQKLQTPFRCNLSTLSPAPSEVLSISVERTEFVGVNKLLVAVRWGEPHEANGVLSVYRICLSQVPLQGNQLETESDACINATVSLD